jgi:hypothetical protein
MKYIIKNLLIVTGLLFFSCTDLDIQPDNIVSEDVLLGQPDGVLSYLATVYAKLPLEDLSNYQNGSSQMENMGRGTNGGPREGRNDIWNYEMVRQLNIFLESIDDYTDNHPAESIETWKGEIKFLQAFQYFLMVRTYGGVPIITETQSYDGSNLEELRVPRNTEKEVWEYIRTTIDEAIALLPESMPSGRASKYAALALKSRAMLYAGSIAEYGDQTFQSGYDGLIGLPAADAAAYYQYSLDASRRIESEGGFSLYEKNADLSKNFADLFLDADMSSNPEVIFTRGYEYPINGHHFDRDIVPFGIRGPNGYGGRMNATLRLIEMYDKTDGTASSLEVNDTNGDPIIYPDALTIFADRDPRLAGTFVLPNAMFGAHLIDVRNGVYTVDGSGTITTTSVGSPGETFPGTTTLIKGKSGYGNQMCLTGFHLRKYSDYRLAISERFNEGSSTDWIEMRYAEILLNIAEAEEALGNLQEAADAINIVRARVNMPALGTGDITAERVQKERTIELALEAHNNWDIRRWRTANLTYGGPCEILLPYLNLDNGEYYFERRDWNSTSFTPENYWRAIPGISTNPNLLPNP